MSKLQPERRVLVQLRQEFTLIDKPSLETLEAINEDTVYLNKLKYKLTLREARMFWLLRNKEPVDFSLIDAHRTHIYNLRKKLEQHNMLVRNLWHGVYQLSIVGAGR
jgi:hypothetical protein